MTKYILIFTLPFLWSLALKAEFISQYDIDMTIKRDGTYFIDEQITYDFERLKRHGITREIPVYLQRPTDTGFGIINANYSLQLDFLDVTDEQGQPLQTKLYQSGSSIGLRIGSPEVYVTGQVIYRLFYRVKRAINFFDDYDEVYWNIIGHEWNVMIKNANIHIEFESALHSDQIKTVAYYGPLGSTQELKLTTTRDGFKASIPELHPREGITFGAVVPKGYFKKPSRVQNLTWFIKDNFPYVWSIAGFLLFLFFYLIRYWRFGRDPILNRSVQVQYHPPKDLTPAEVGTLIDEQADNEDITSTILYLAVHHHLKIEVNQATSLTFFNNQIYTFIKKHNENFPLEPFEESFKSKLFGNKESIELSELHNNFGIHITSLKRQLYKNMVSKKLFDSCPDRVRLNYLGLGIIAAMAYSFLGIVIAVKYGSQQQALPILVSGLLCTLLTFFFSKRMPRRTKKGVKSLIYLHGLKEFIHRVEEKTLRDKINEDPNIFGEILPYAIVLGCADEWAKKFEKIMTTMPEWYACPHDNNIDGFNSVNFMGQLGSGLNTMNKSFTSVASSSGSGGSSIRSSSGGFSGSSGGGFGGGGGGSW